MSGYGGRIAFEGSRERGKQLLGVAMKLASVQQQNKNILGLNSMTRTYDLGGGAYCVVVDLPHMRAMQIVAPEFGGVEPEEPIEEFIGRAGPGVYDVLAGYTNDPQILVEQMVINDKGDTQDVEVIAHFKPTLRTGLRHKDLTRRRRLAVRENPIFLPLEENPKDWTEHAHIKPTNYSGLMRPVVQLILGLGKIIRPTTEEKLKLPPLPPIGKDLITGKALTMISAFGLYGNERGWIPRVDFDYRASKTHGVTFDSDGVPWLIEIGHRGVHAMRLYLDPVSMTKEGRARWVEVSPELTDFLKVFPGIPLGITMPTFEIFDKWKRAGEVVELLSSSALSGFNSRSPMSSDTGWCFSPNGQEAHNTCTDYDLKGIKRGHHYSISVIVHNERFKDWTPARSSLAAKFSDVYEINKCRRMSERDAEQILRVYTLGEEKGYKAFDEFIVKPTLDAMASIAMQRMGFLYHPAKFEFQPQIKFPEQLVGGCLSLDLSDIGDGGPRRVFRQVKCDTPVYACYIDGKLDVINYAYDSSKPPLNNPPTNESDRLECQVTGGWTVTSSSGGDVVMQGHFYSNRRDMRREQQQGGTVITKYTSKKVAAYPMFHQEHFFSTVHYAYTMVSFYVESVATTAPQAPQLVISVAVPMRDRCAYYMAKLEDRPSSSIYYSSYIDTYTARQTDEWSVYHFVAAWVGGPHCPEQEWIDKAPMDCHGRHRCIWINDDACVDDYLHGGMWLNACPPGPGWTAPFEGPKWQAPPMPSTYSYSVPDDKGQANSDIYFVNDTPHGETIVWTERATAEQGGSYSVWWTRASPDENGAMPTIQAVNSCLGEPVTNMMNDYDGDLRHLGGPEYMFGSWHSCYTGVIE